MHHRDDRHNFLPAFKISYNQLIGFILWYGSKLCIKKARGVRLINIFNHIKYRKNITAVIKCPGLDEENGECWKCTFYVLME